MNERLRFHTFDALRFFAFLKVYLLHLPYQLEAPWFNFIKGGGGIGVYFFFVLSGFLITYILVTEKMKEGKLRIGRFFVRRSFRIWPLYFLLVTIVFLLPYEFKEHIGLHMVGGGYEFDPKFSFTFLENYKMILMDNYPKTTPLNVFWSLCIEEHFYLIWMVSLAFIPVKRLPWFFGISVLVAIAARIVSPMILNNTHIDTGEILTNLDLFAMGGIVGYLVATNYQKVAARIHAIPMVVKVLFILLVIAMVIARKYMLPAYGGSLHFIRPTIIAATFALLIAVFVPQDSRLRIGDKNPLTFLGKISYGLYVYHIVLIHLTSKYCKNHDIALDNWTNMSIYIAFTFVATVVVSYCSYRFFEMPFLKLREKLAK